MSSALSIYVFILFVILSPGVLLTLPSKTSTPLIIALVHALVFTIVFSLAHKPIMDMSEEKKY